MNEPQQVPLLLGRLYDQCVRLTRLPEDRIDGSRLQDIERALAAIYSALASTIVRLEAWQGWSADADHPGYLVRSQEGLDIRVPWNLAADLPDEELLAALVDLTRKVSSGNGSTITISGSAAALAAFQHVCDVDLCEYLPGAPGAVSGAPATGLRAIVKHAGTLTGQILLRGLWLTAADGSRGPELSRPWSTPPWQDETLLQEAASSRRGKCDFVANTDFEGVVELTNLALIVDGAGYERFSFPLQEVPVADPGGWVPRRLVSPLEVGRHIGWLSQEVTRLVEPQNPDESVPGRTLLKATKRTLSLARLLFLSDEVDQLLDLAQQGDLPLLPVVAARLELWEQIHGSADPELAAFEPRLLFTLNQLTSELALDLPSSPAVSFDDDGDSWTRWVAAVAERLEDDLKNSRMALQQGLKAINATIRSRIAGTGGPS